MSHLLLTTTQLVVGLNIAITASVCCLVAAAIGLTRRLPLTFRHAALVVGMLVCAASPAIVATSPQFVNVTLVGSLRSMVAQDIPVDSEVQRQSSAVEIDNRENAIGAPPAGNIDFATEIFATHAVRPESAAAAATVSWPLPRMFGTILLVIWLSGSVVVLGKSLSGYRSIRRLLASCSVASDESILAAARDVACRIGIKKTPTVLQSDAVPIPLVFGGWHPRIVIPTDAEHDYSESELRDVLTHELAHIARRDHWVIILQNFAFAMHWWNPLVRLVYRQLSEARELICDDIVMAQRRDPGEYAATIIRMAERVAGLRTAPSALGIGLSRNGELERRVRRILNRGTQPVNNRLGWLAMTGVAAVFCLMLIGAAAAQVPFQSNTESLVEGNGERPNLDKLMHAFARHERSYLPYHVKAMETLRMNTGLSPGEKRRYPWADGRKHQRRMEYAQREINVWLRKETMLLDDDVRGQFEQYNDSNRQIKVSERPWENDDLRVYLDQDEYRAKMVFATPYAGVFPLSVYSESMLFSEASAEQKIDVGLDWDGEDAVLEFQFGWVDKPMRFRLWLSRAHDWHPIKLQRYNTADSKQFFSEWRATRLERASGGWRIRQGTMAYRHREDMESDEAKVMYFNDFEVLSAEFGDLVTSDRFVYEIPKHARVHDASKPKALKPIGETRTLTVNVVGIDGNPISGANIRFQTRDRQQIESVVTGKDGVGQSKKVPMDVLIDVTAPGYRSASWINGPGRGETRVILAPATTGTTNDVAGAAVADVWITSRGLGFRPDGLVQIPRHEFADRENDWSDKSGRFVLSTQLKLLRRFDQQIPVAAVDDTVDNMAFAFVPASHLGRHLDLTLRPACHVAGEIVFDDEFGDKRHLALVVDEQGRQLAVVTPSVRKEAVKTQLAFKLRLPEGSYRLKSLPSASHPAFSIPLTIKPEQVEFNFGVIAL